MSWAARINRPWVKQHAIWSVLLSVCLMAASPAPAQNSEAPASAEMAAQKARMLEVFFSSYRLRQALGSNPDAVGPLVAKARAKLAEGKTALADGRTVESILLFDAGMHTVSEAIAMTSHEAVWDSQAASDAFTEKRQQAGSYLDVIEHTGGLSGAERADIASLRTRLSEADRQFADGDLKPAREVLDHIYRDVVSLVSDIRRGHTIVVRRVFETPRDEFEYERHRNQSYNLLVQIALAERGEEQPGLADLAARLTAESVELRDQAEREGVNGEFVTAIDTMERATERLLVVLRASGVAMME